MDSRATRAVATHRSRPCCKESECLDFLPAGSRQWRLALCVRQPLFSYLPITCLGAFVPQACLQWKKKRTHLHRTTRRTTRSLRMRKDEENMFICIHHYNITSLQPHPQMQSDENESFRHLFPTASSKHVGN